MNYLDFSGLLILAIGCNLIYIVNENNETTRLSFFLILKLINNTKETISKLVDNDASAMVIFTKLKELKKKTIDEIEKDYGKNSDYILKNRNINININSLTSMREKYERIIVFFYWNGQTANYNGNYILL